MFDSATVAVDRTVPFKFQTRIVLPCPRVRIPPSARNDMSVTPVVWLAVAFEALSLDGCKAVTQRSDFPPVRCHNVDGRLPPPPHASQSPVRFAATAPTQLGPLSTALPRHFDTTLASRGRSTFTQLLDAGCRASHKRTYQPYNLPY